MKPRTKYIAIGIVLSATSISVATTLQTPGGDPEVVEMLSGISYSPNKNRIDLVMGEAALEDLIRIAEDESTSADAGVRLRALRALGQFSLNADTKRASVTLRQSISSFAVADRGTDLLLLRASLLSLAELERGESVSDLVPLLDHPSRDIRAATARALGISRSASATQPLLNRALVETTNQVKLAISDALFVLDQANPPN